MELLVLQRLVRELDEALRGRRIDQVYALPKHDVVFVVGRRSGPRLWFSTDPDRPHLYLRPGPHPTPKRPPGFAMAARNALCGRRIEAVEWMYRDRVVQLRFAGDAAVRVIFELIPRRATGLILGQDDTVIAAWQPRRGRPGLGDAYAPPRADRRRSVEEIDDITWDGLSASADEDALTRGLVRSIAGLSPTVAREIAFKYRPGGSLLDVVRAEIDRADRAATDARIYTPRPLDELRSLPAAREFFVAPYELDHAAAEVGRGSRSVERYQTLTAAVAAYYPLWASLAGLDTARDALVSALELGRARAQRTLEAVAGDADAVGDAEQLRGWADLLLAYPNAERDGTVARVPDPWAKATDARKPLELPIDPSLSLVENAQVYYGRARRAERSIQRTARRRKRLESRIESLSVLAAEAEASSDIRDCYRIARAAREHGVSVRTERWALPEGTHTGDVPGEREPVDAGGRRQAAGPRTASGTSRATREPPGVDLYESSDGYEILVGRNARANERVTHDLAAPHDFWLHAEGPGSHVIIRNPQRAESPSSTALRQAASLAAYFSFARGATKVNVRWTQARRVKKPRGGPTGQVILRRANTYLAEPRAPEDLFGED